MTVRASVSAAGADEVLGGELLQAHEAESLGAVVRARVEVLEG